MIGSQCQSNNDCWTSTFCCSQGNCVPGSICYKGQKQPDDFCDYGFECLSRCCTKTICSNVIECVETCQWNADCQTYPCCSFGYCSATMELCSLGQKEDLDLCEASSECLSGNCISNRCTTISTMGLDTGSPQVALALMLGVIVMVLLCACCLTRKRFINGSDTNYSRQASD